MRHHENNDSIGGERVLRIDEVMYTVGLRKTALYGMIGEGAFPRPVPIGSRAVGWLASEVSNWLAARIAARDRDAA